MEITLDKMVFQLAEVRDMKFGRNMLSKWLRSRVFKYKKRPHMHRSSSTHG